MKSKAILMTLAMMSAALAGCTGSDGVTEIDDETLQQLFDDNIQDFMNNTSIIVNQEIHYHNNTTTIVDDGDYSSSVVNEYNNTTNIDGGEVLNNYEQNDYSNTNYSLGSSGASFGEGVNGTSSGYGMMFVAHLEFTAMDLFPEYQEAEDPQNNSFSYDYAYYDYLTNSYRNDTFTFSCSVFYVVGSQSNNGSVSYWMDSDNYYNAWEQMYNSTIADMLNSASNDNNVRNICHGPFVQPIASASDGLDIDFLTIDIPAGYAIQYIQYDGDHTAFGCESIQNVPWCDEAGNYYQFTNTLFWNWSAGPTPYYTQETLYGGWDNLSVEFSLDLSSYQGTCRDANGNYLYDENGNYLQCDYDYGQRSVWPSSTYDFTLYYRFVPVIPVE